MQFVKKHPAESHRSLVADLYQQHAPALLMFICRYVPTREDAEDVLLEVFQAAVESEILTTLDEGRQRAWLWKVAHNKSTDHYRRSQRRPLSSASLEDIEDVLYDDDFQTPESAALRQEAYAELRTHILSLSELQQQVLRLRFAQDLRCSEIAQQLNKSDTAIRTLLSRSLNLLRTIYKQSRENN